MLEGEASVSATPSNADDPRCPRERHARNGMPSGPDDELLLVLMACLMCLCETLHLLCLLDSLGCFVLGVECGPDCSSGVLSVCFFLLCVCVLIVLCGPLISVVVLRFGSWCV